MPTVGRHYQMLDNTEETFSACLTGTNQEDNAQDTDPANGRIRAFVENQYRPAGVSTF